MPDLFMYLVSRNIEISPRPLSRGMLDFWGRVFSESNEMIMWEFFQFICIVDYPDGFPYIQPSLHHQDEAYFIMVDDFSHMFLDSVLHYCTEYFCIHVCESDWSAIFFLASLCVLLVRVTIASYIWQNPLFSLVWNNLRRIGISSKHSRRILLHWKYLVLGCFGVEHLMTICRFFGVICLCNFFIWSYFNFDMWYLSRELPISLKLSKFVEYRFLK